VDDKQGILYKSTEAYLRLYKKVLEAISKGERIQIIIE
jgi:hypothetical protein